MICGRTPFVASTQWLTFERIRSGTLSFPIGFPEDAEDLVRQLLECEEHKRLGANDTDLLPIKQHPFFLTIDWDTISTTDPPALCAPSEPFLFEVETNEDISDEGILKFQQEQARKALIEKQSKTPVGQFLIANREAIVHQGFLSKRAGIWNNARRRVFLVTDWPRIIYIDPERNILKGEIPWDASLRVEVKDPNNFLIHVVCRFCSLLACHQQQLLMLGRMALCWVAGQNLCARRSRRYCA
jgi:3-phosphoinositide dependent protein kinase-1